ncbi:MAG: TrkA family potassium uptake protein [Firmicutes bacterium HGW-Firmicutes-16]|nr:MAG: TrkA family potassium uptake protein [Firmicutes bacterium HGW-Firmicutes-16]
MYIIIVGCGRLGGTLSEELSDAGHNVSVIDREGSRLEALGSGFNGLRVKGIEYDSKVLKEAGISRADYLIAATSDDNLNITVSLVAKETFKVRRVIARVNEPSKKSVYELLNIQTINPTELISYIIKSRIEGNSR